MILYYEGPDARITDVAFEAWQRYHQRFLIRDLYDVCYTCGGMDRLATRSLAAFAGTAVLVSASWPLLHSPMDWVAAAFAVAVPGVVSGACYKLRQPEMALRARYKGLHVQLYASTDARRFGQVRRALVRSLEGCGR